jgi:TRAP-type uncharacterized transport system fused permease subunit
LIATVAVSVYLLSVRYRTRLVGIGLENLQWKDWTNIAAFSVVLGGLVGMMAICHLAPTFAALYVFLAVVCALFIVNGAALMWSGSWSALVCFKPLAKFIDSFTEMTADITLLLATLSIMTGALVITGVPTKIGNAADRGGRRSR